MLPNVRFKAVLCAFFILVIRISLVTGQNSILEHGIETLSLTGCSVQDHVIKIVGTGDIQHNKAFFYSETTLDEIDMNFNIRVDSMDTVGEFLFGIGKYSGIAGTMVEFLGTTTNTSILINRLTGTSPTFISQFVLPFKLSIGQNYRIRIGKRIRKLVIEVVSDDGTDHYLNDSLTFPNPFFGCLWGTPFIGCNSGAISVTGFSLTTPFSISPRLAIWGDSFIEGNALTDVEQRYVSLIKDSIGHQNIAIMGRGGENSSGVNTRFPKESSWFRKSKYALIAIGVNDVNFTTWKNNIIKYLDTLKKFNIIPIIATLSPRSDRLAFITLVNNWIRNDYNGAYIDVNQALSPDERHWGEDMGVIDSIHPSPVGHRAIYERIKQEAPYIFRDIDPFTIDYVNETTFENINNSFEYSDTSNFFSPSFGSERKIPVSPGEIIYFRDTTITTHMHSLYDILSVPQRPSAPTNGTFNAFHRSIDWANNPAYLNFINYEYSVDSGMHWTGCTMKPQYIDNATMSFQLRIKATNSNFKSDVLFMDTLITPPQYTITAYPNPVVDKLIIDNITPETQFTLYSIDGRIVKTILLSDRTTVINMEDLRSGAYILILYNDKLKRTFKILKK